MPILKKQNISICYEAFGKPTNPSIIFIAGIAAQLIQWPSALTQGLVDVGFHVVTFDNCDVGQSSHYDDLKTPSITEVISAQEKNQSFKPPDTLNDMASDLLVLMDGLQIRQVHIVGVSMDGQIAQILAIEHPERLLSLTLIATSSGDSGLPSPGSEVLNFFLKSNISKSNFESLTISNGL